MRTNGGAACRTSYRSIEDLPSDPDFLNSLDYTADTWNETDVWVIQEKMLLGLIGNQGIATNAVLSSWLRVDIPPMPPAFSLDNSVYVVRFADGTHAALQLQDYQSSTGTKCCLTINYKYPI